MRYMAPEVMVLNDENMSVSAGDGRCSQARAGRDGRWWRRRLAHLRHGASDTPGRAARRAETRAEIDSADEQTRQVAPLAGPTSPS